MFKWLSNICKALPGTMVRILDRADKWRGRVVVQRFGK